MTNAIRPLIAGNWKMNGLKASMAEFDAMCAGAAGVAAKAFAALAARNINIRAITTSEIKFSVLIDAAYTELAVRTLHTLYGLDQG